MVQCIVSCCHLPRLNKVCCHCESRNFVVAGVRLPFVEQFRPWSDKIRSKFHFRLKYCVILVAIQPLDKNYRNANNPVLSNWVTRYLWWYCKRCHNDIGDPLSDYNHSSILYRFQMKPVVVMIMLVTVCTPQLRSEYTVSKQYLA